jgi:hypothetical protein
VNFRAKKSPRNFGLAHYICLNGKPLKDDACLQD